MVAGELFSRSPFRDGAVLALSAAILMKSGMRPQRSTSSVAARGSR